MRNANKGDFQPFNASKWKIGIVAARFNQDITDELLKNALKAAKKYQIPVKNIKIVKVAGSIEIPLALQKLARERRYKSLLAIGCVIRGETPHFDYVCKMVSEGVLRVQLDESISIGFGILTCNTLAQAKARAHLGGEHLAAALHLARVI